MEIAEANVVSSLEEMKNNDSDSNMVESENKKRKLTTKAKPGNKKPNTQVTIQTVNRAISEMTNTPSLTYLRTCPLAHKVVLAAVLAVQRRRGSSEVELREIVDEAGYLVRMYNNDDFMPIYECGGRAGGLWYAIMDMMAVGIISMNDGKVVNERIGKLKLLIQTFELKEALADDEQIKPMLPKT